MSDRELLELAAKAAGLKPGSWHDGWNDEGRETGDYWNPLTDDGDALRLAVKLGMDVLFDAESVEVISTQHGRMDDGEMIAPWAWEHLRTDPYAATRRAITRAAAEIGRSKE